MILSQNCKSYTLYALFVSFCFYFEVSKTCLLVFRGVSSKKVMKIMKLIQKSNNLHFTTSCDNYVCICVCMFL